MIINHKETWMVKDGDELEKFRLKFSRCANHDVTPLMHYLFKHKRKKITYIEDNTRRPVDLHREKAGNDVINIFTSEVVESTPPRSRM